MRSENSPLLFSVLSFKIKPKMEILALRLFESDRNVSPPVENSTPKSRIKVDLSDTKSPVPGEESDMLEAVYGIVGPSIVTFGLIGNILILFVVKKSSMSGKTNVNLGNSQF